ncbi:MAG TPA: hypothetical protein VFB54_16660 [Burkholderiales bacterium]|nr:hypothetical protein [Burkholderiales bacterium]
MGQEIDRIQFTRADFEAFDARLRAETDLLERAWRDGRFGDPSFTAGCELEAWLIDHNHFPLPRNEAYLARLNDPLVVPELSTFNVELNCTPVALRERAFRKMEEELAATWCRCVDVAHGMDGQLVMIGTLPTIRQRDLTLAHISRLNRYFALNDQVVHARGGRPINIDIRGREHLRLTHDDVMLEAGTTSFQVHLQCPPEDVTRYYNASIILSAPLVALAANSPYLFGHDLWDETRVPLFEQAVDVGEGAQARVTFGQGYLNTSPIEAFVHNLEAYPVLLPIVSDGQPHAFRHLRLHNGTVWRWNRLLIGFNDEDVPHLRIEQRVMPAGPSIIDMMTNAALYIGASRVLATLREAPEVDLPFAVARDNFYRAAREGLDARVVWLDGREIEVQTLWLDELLPMANEGLQLLEIDDADRERYLDIAAARLRNRQNGAAWQRGWCAKHGRDWLRLSVAYLEQQRIGSPVHEWPI